MIITVLVFLAGKDCMKNQRKVNKKNQYNNLTRKIRKCVIKSLDKRMNQEQFREHTIQYFRCAAYHTITVALLLLILKLKFNKMHLFLP